MDMPAPTAAAKHDIIKGNLFKEALTNTRLIEVEHTAAGKKEISRICFQGMLQDEGFWQLPQSQGCQTT